MGTKINNSLIDFSKYSEDENYTKLEKKINNLLELYDNISNKDDKQKILENIEEIKNKLDINNINTSISYPDYDDKKFIEKLITKKEFAINKIEKYNQENIKKEFFELTNNQKFLKKLISPETPYRSIYLYHGVGVGKTCASIQISDNFKTYFNKKTLVLLPLKLKDNFIKELFDIGKLKDDNMEQCLGNYYLHNIVGRDKMETSEIKSKVKKMINSEYEILSFGEFGNLFNRIKTNSKNNIDFINKLRIYFDNRTIIVDEVHNMRLVNEDVKGKEVSKSFHQMLEALNNNVLVLLSATPMFDNHKELKFILNSLLIQNGKKKIDKNDKIFEDDKLNPDFEKRLKKISSSFISYMRGENPDTFPIRLYPSINDNKNILSIDDYPKLDINGNKILKNEQVKHLELIQTKMSDMQQKIYDVTNINSNNNNSNNDDDDDEDSVDIQQRVQISNIVYGKLNEDIKKVYGNEGLEKVFKIDAKKKGEYKVQYKEDYKNNQILDSSNVGTYSPKIKLLLKNINKSNGIILVYSRYLAAGVIPIAIALEHFGFNKYGGNNILKQGKRENKKGNYIIISGNTGLSPNNTKEIAISTNKNNKDGDKIKVILITESGSEGIDLKNVREIHIFDPWYNLNRLEQIIGRGVRNFSHIELDPKLRNTTIYQYVNLTQDNKRESIDFRTYRIAENKQKKISTLERIIKRNAIDCNLNININRFDDLKPIKLITSRGKLIEKFDINDKDGSRICDYRDCDLKCDKEVKIEKLDESTYKKENINYDIKLVTRYLIKYFQSYNSGTIEDLIKNIKLNIKYKETLYFALNHLVKNKIIFQGIKKRRGYIIYKSNRYIFQPEDIKDEKILTEERTKEKIIKSKKIDIKNIEINETNTSNNDKKYSNYNEYLNIEIKKITNELLFDDTDIKKEEDIIYDILIDTFNEKDYKKLIDNILKDKIDKNKYDKIISSMKRGLYIQKNENIIYNHYNDKFYCINENKIDKCAPLQDKTNRKLLKKSLENIKENINIDRLGYLEKTKNDYNPVLKIIDLKKKDQDKKVSGTKCIDTTTIKVSDVEKYINEYEKENKVSILKNKKELIEKFNKKKYKKTNLCLLYQLVLRKKNNNKNLYFLRPIINNFI